MSKKKKKNKKKHQKDLYAVDIFGGTEIKSKKDLSKQFKEIIKDIESYQIALYEADKKSNRKERRKINKKQKEFYTDMEAIKCRKNMAKDWEKSGFLDKVADLLNQVSPVVKTVAKLVAVLIITFLSLDFIKSNISPSTLEKIAKVFDVAMSV